MAILPFIFHNWIDTTYSELSYDSKESQWHAEAETCDGVHSNEKTLLIWSGEAAAGKGERVSLTSHSYRGKEQLSLQANACTKEESESELEEGEKLSLASSTLVT